MQAGLRSASELTEYGQEAFRQVSILAVFPRFVALRLIEPCMTRGGQFQSYRTSAYRFHFHETLTGYKFILLSDPLADNMQFVLKAIYSGPFLDFVVRNDLVGVKGGGLDESWGITAEKGKIRGRGIDNDRVSDSLSSIWPVKLKCLVRVKVPHSRGSLRQGSHQFWSMIAASELAYRSSDVNGLCNDLRHHLIRMK